MKKTSNISGYPPNKPKSYAIIDENDKRIEYYRTKALALYELPKLEKMYFKELKIKKLK